jgi:hypothetical protein
MLLQIDIGFVHPPLGAAERLDIHDFPAEDHVAALPDEEEQMA